MEPGTRTASLSKQGDTTESDVPEWEGVSKPVRGGPEILSHMHAVKY